MATRHQTYQMSYGWITIDTHAETPPLDFISGPYDVTIAERKDIDGGASIEIDPTGQNVNIVVED